MGSVLYDFLAIVWEYGDGWGVYLERYILLNARVRDEVVASFTKINALILTFVDLSSLTAIYVVWLVVAGLWRCINWLLGIQRQIRITSALHKLSLWHFFPLFPRCHHLLGGYLSLFTSRWRYKLHPFPSADRLGLNFNENLGLLLDGLLFDSLKSFVETHHLAARRSCLHSWLLHSRGMSWIWGRCWILLCTNRCLDKIFLGLDLNLDVAGLLSPWCLQGCLYHNTALMILAVGRFQVLPSNQLCPSVTIIIDHILNLSGQRQCLVAVSHGYEILKSHVLCFILFRVTLVVLIQSLKRCFNIMFQVNFLLVLLPKRSCCAIPAFIRLIEKISQRFPFFE